MVLLLQVSHYIIISSYLIRKKATSCYSTIPLSYIIHHIIIYYHILSYIIIYCIYTSCLACCHCLPDVPQRSMSTARSGTPCVTGHVSIHCAGDLPWDDWTLKDFLAHHKIEKKKDKKDNRYMIYDIYDIYICVCVCMMYMIYDIYDI